METETRRRELWSRLEQDNGTYNGTFSCPGFSGTMPSSAKGGWQRWAVELAMGWAERVVAKKKICRVGNFLAQLATAIPAIAAKVCRKRVEGGKRKDPGTARVF